MNTMQESCALGLATETLAAWHDDALSADESRRIGAHVRNCPACQERLAREDALDAALRGQRAPEPDARLWRGVRAGMERHAIDSRWASGPESRRRIVSGVGAIAAALLVVLGFAQVFRIHLAGVSSARATVTVQKPVGTATPLPTVAPAAPPIAGTQQHWSPVTLPPNTLSDNQILSLAVSASDGATAYLCSAISYPVGQRPQIWATDDQGGHWAQVGQLPAAGEVSDCAIWVDTFVPSRVVAVLMGQDMNTLADITKLYASDDSGATWREVPGVQELRYLTTIQQTSFAIRVAGSGQSELAVSHDGLQTWQPIDQMFTQASQMVVGFWMRPDGDLLAEVEPQLYLPTVGPGTPQPQHTPLRIMDTLWETHDGGGHWVQVPAPQEEHYTAQWQSVTGQWQICGWSIDNRQSVTTAEQLACSTDGGRIWTARPPLLLPLSCTGSSCNGQTAATGQGEFILTDDGAILDLAPYRLTRQGTIQEMNSFSLYRLPAGSAQWEYLGPIPGGAVLYAPAPGNGVFWGFTGGEHLGMLSGIIGGHQALPRTLSVAEYTP